MGRWVDRQIDIDQPVSTYRDIKKWFVFRGENNLYLEMSLPGLSTHLFMSS